MYYFVTGGYRSGRSNYALRKVTELGPPPWGYAFRGVETDEAIRKRIARHDRDSESTWLTEPIPTDLHAWLADANLERFGALVLDGFPHWIDELVRREQALDDTHILDMVQALGERLYRSARPIVLVTQEIGLAPMPTSPIEAAVVRITTSANQLLAVNAESVVLMVSGVPLRVR